jgi:hypothetical protein
MNGTFPRPLGTAALGVIAILAATSGLASAESPEPLAQTTEVPGASPQPGSTGDQTTGLPQSPPVLPNTELPPGSTTTVPGTSGSTVMDAGSLIGVGGAGEAGLGYDAGSFSGTGGAGAPATGASTNPATESAADAGTY